MPGQPTFAGRRSPTATLRRPCAIRTQSWWSCSTSEDELVQGRDEGVAPDHGRPAREGPLPWVMSSERVALGDRTQDRRTRLCRALEGGAVDGMEPEPRPEAEDPLEVVQQRPVDVPLQRDSVVHRLLELSQRSRDQLRADRVVVGADTMLGDDDWNSRDLVRVADGA